MAKLVVEVVSATGLMPKDGHGSATSFVQVHYNEQMSKTQSIPRDLNPEWNEKLVFHIKHPSDLLSSSIHLVIYNHSPHRSFLGQVHVPASSVAPSHPSSSLLRFPLEKRSPFSNIRGHISLRLFLLLLPLSDHNHPDEQEEEEKYQLKNIKEPIPPTSFSSIPLTQEPKPHAPAAAVQVRSDLARSFPASSVMTQTAARGGGEYQVVETNPMVGARVGYRGDKLANTYDLVEQMQYLYVRVVKGRGVDAGEEGGEVSVEVRAGNCKGVSRSRVGETEGEHVWKQVFAFPKEKVQAQVVEVVVRGAETGVVGRVVFEVGEVPRRVPPDSPLAAEWYKMAGRGEVMAAVWMGTQADEAFPVALHADAHRLGEEGVVVSSTRSKVYFSPRLYYLRVTVVGVEELVFRGGGAVGVRVNVGTQRRETAAHRVGAGAGAGAVVWNEEMMFVVAEPLEEFIVLSVVDKSVPANDLLLGDLVLPVRGVPQRHDATKEMEPRWFSLRRPQQQPAEEVAGAEGEDDKKEAKFSCKIQLRACLEGGYHVLDESTPFSSDLQPSSKSLWKTVVGVLEVGFLGARNLPPAKGGDGRTADAYCVAKYGNKWVRTRTIVDTVHPAWNEQYSWEVYDPCTVVSVGVFGNGLGGSPAEGRIGKVRIRVSTLETEKVYTHYYPLVGLEMAGGGVRKRGELHLAVRFRCTGWGEMVSRYGGPLLPKMHYLKPIPVRQVEWLRHQAAEIVGRRLGRAEPPLRREVVEYMLDVDYAMFSVRRSKVNFYRIMALLSAVAALCRWFDRVSTWRNPVTTSLVHLLFIILLCYPELILPTLFLCLFAVGLSNYRKRVRQPPHTDARLSHAEYIHPDEMDEELDTFPTSRGPETVRARYDRLRSLAGRVQTVVGDIATQGERALGILGWRDPRATSIFLLFSLFAALCFYVTPFRVLAGFYGLYALRHPRFRNRMPSVPVNFFKRLPSKSDFLL